MTAVNTWSYIYETLKGEILSMRLLPGEFIGEIDTAKRFKVSRTPVRDALKKLSQDGLLKIIPQKGSFVTKIKLKGVTDLVYVREKVELAVLDEISGKIPEDFILEFQTCLSKQREIANGDDGSLEASIRFVDSDNKFHKLIFALAGKQTVWKWISEFSHDYNRIRILSSRCKKDALKALCDKHAAIFECMLNRDKPRLVEEYSDHLYAGLGLIEEIYSQNGGYLEDE